MSNNIKALIVAIIAVIAISGIYILTKSRPVENVPNTGVSSVSQMASSFRSKAVLSSSSVVVSSSSTGVSKIIETPKTSEVAIIPKSQTQCNLPQSENLVKTDDGCFELLISGQNSDNKNFNNIFKSISKDFFYKILNYTKNTETVINLNFRPNSQEYQVYISANIKKISEQNKNLPNVSLFNSFYSIDKDNFKFLFFELRGDGRTQKINDVVTQYNEYLKI